jgi:hypothetical protein
MFLINPQLTDNNLNNDGYNALLEGIDKTIALLATAQYQNHVFGFRQHVDFLLYDRLCEYREILIDKMMGCNCLEDEYLIYITSKIQKLIC